MKKLSYAKKNQAGMAITPRPPIIIIITQFLTRHMSVKV